MARLVIVPDETFEALALALKQRLPAIVRDVTAENLCDLVGEHGQRVLTGVVRDPATQELLLWGRSPRAFAVGWTSLAPEHEVVGAVTASVREGLVSRVAGSGQPALEPGAALRASAWTNLEERRGRALDGMAAAPVVLFGKCAAVATLVSYRTDRAAGALDHAAAAELAAWGSVFTRLIEDRLIRACVGIETL